MLSDNFQAKFRCCFFVFFQVCLAWPAASFPGGKIGLLKSTQNSLKVKPGDGVTVHPLTGPVLQAKEVLLSTR